MTRKTQNATNRKPTEATAVPYTLPMKEAAAFTHMSVHFIRKGVKDGTIKHFRSGCKVYVHIPALLETLDALSGVTPNQH